MPRAFDQEERERITASLLAAGERLFTTQGLRKTSLDELVAAAGIAKSSFYAFFDSKESLYLELMLRQAPVLRAELNRALELPDSAEAVRHFLRGAIDVLHHNPLYRRMVTHPDEMEAVLRRITPERLAELKRTSLLPVLEFIERAQREGRFAAGDPAVLEGVLRTVLLLPMHADQFDPAVYPRVIEAVIDIVSAGLTRRTTSEE
ncbi:TetR/AcrR family transcriptional regulator [Streptoalloteichus hindustanus]|uniref:Transcriptional regulator, TetR family n=1 Tax=Streptoalloteichus hindustanus TaxID=2017 RepID=A0A1M5P1M6_STRHI|nr:TetR/AcrR family transcriptional regulator [Streptoalloteichus hindustanus]SHG95716.1 transcriptional regulator, TetR family [Streptoalloteichus hindustanus]